MDKDDKLHLFDSDEDNNNMNLTNGSNRQVLDDPFSQAAQQQEAVAELNANYNYKKNDVQAQDYSKIGGNNLLVKDPACPPYTHANIMISGHIQSGTLNERDGICCRFDFMAG